jgi:uncharacterized protein YbjT (DUF2867 family)
MILVAGGTGTMGVPLLGLLADRGLDTRVLTRDPTKSASVRGSGVHIVPGDVRDPSVVGQAVAGARTVVSAITGFGPDRGVSPRTVDWEGNANLIRAAKAAGVEHFILLSVCRAAPDHPIELFRMKYRAEEELRASGLAWTIIRPTAYMETWLGLLGTQLLQTGRTRIFGRGENPINFVSASDIARFVELSVIDPAMQGVAFDAGGPENLTMKDLVRTFATITGARGKVSHVPLPMMRVMSFVMRPVNPAMAGLIAAAVVMDTTDMTFEPSETGSRFPSVSPTNLADVVRRDYVQTQTADDTGSTTP